MLRTNIFPIVKVCSTGWSFLASPRISMSHIYGFRFHRFSHKLRIVPSDIDLEVSKLPEDLRISVKQLRDLPDQYSQLLHLSYLAKNLEPMSPELQTPQNRIKDAYSTVYIHATSRDGGLYFQGYSDWELMRGFIAVMVNGLSGCSTKEISNIKPDLIIKYAELNHFFTPRNSHEFHKLLHFMQKKASDLEIDMSPEALPERVKSHGNPTRKSIVSKLSLLRPEVLEVIDESATHAEPAIAQSVSTTETHFKIKIVAYLFSNLSFIERHKMIYDLLSQEPAIEGLQALTIDAKTPYEISYRKHKFNPSLIPPFLVMLSSGSVFYVLLS